MSTFTELVETGVLDSLVKEIERTDDHVEISKYKSLTPKIRKTKFAIVDDCTWIAKKKSAKFIFSGNDKGQIGKCKKGASSFNYMQVHNGKLVPKEAIEFSTDEEREEKSKLYQEKKEELKASARKLKETRAKREQEEQKAREEEIRRLYEKQQEELEKAKREKEEIEKQAEMLKERLALEKKEKIEQEKILKDKIEESRKMDVNKSVQNLNLTGTGGLEALSAKANQTASALQTQAQPAQAQAQVPDQTGIKVPARDEQNQEDLRFRSYAEFNTKNGGMLLGLIYDKDCKIAISADKIQNNKKKPTSNDVANQNTVSVDADSSQGVTTLRQLKPKQSKPSKLIGAMIKIPKGGYFKITEYDTGRSAYNRDEPIVPSLENGGSDIKYLLLDMETAYALIGYAFHGKIKCDPETFGLEQQWMMVDKKELTASQKKNNKHNGLPFRNVLVSSTKKSAIAQEGAYFPIKRYKTINASKAMTDEERDLVNFSLVEHLFKTQRSSSVKFIDELIAEDRNKIEKITEPGKPVKYTTSWFPKSGGGVALNIKPWHMPKGDDKTFVTELEIPVKEEVRSKNDNVSIKPILISCLKDEKEELQQQDTLHIDKFKRIRELSNGLLTKESLLKAFKPNNRNKTTGIVSDANEFENWRDDMRANIKTYEEAFSNLDGLGAL